jgi:hypothetical protein
MYVCINPNCKNRKIDIDPVYKARWVHLDSGMAMCEPLNDPLKKALPKPPAERMVETPQWWQDQQSAR